PAPSPTHTPTLSLHDALPISAPEELVSSTRLSPSYAKTLVPADELLYMRRPSGSYLNVTVPPLAGKVTEVNRFSKSQAYVVVPVDRKSTRLNSSHLVISYAVF